MDGAMKRRDKLKKNYDTGRNAQNADVDYDAKLRKILDERSKRMSQGFWVRFAFGFVVAFLTGFFVFMGFVSAQGVFWPGMAVVLLISCVIAVMAGVFGEEFIEALLSIGKWF